MLYFHEQGTARLRTTIYFRSRMSDVTTPTCPRRTLLWYSTLSFDSEKSDATRPMCPRQCLLWYSTLSFDSEESDATRPMCPRRCLLGGEDVKRMAQNQNPKK